MVLSRDTGHARAYGTWPYGDYGTANGVIFPVRATDDRFSRPFFFARFLPALEFFARQLPSLFRERGSFPTCGTCRRGGPRSSSYAPACRRAGPMPFLHAEMLGDPT